MAGSPRGGSVTSTRQSRGTFPATISPPIGYNGVQKLGLEDWNDYSVPDPFPELLIACSWRPV